MAKVIDKRPNGVALVEVAADDARDLEVGADVEVHRSRIDGAQDWPEPFGALAGTLPELEIDDIKTARTAALATQTDNEIRVLTPEQWEQLADDKARKYLGISAKELERRLDAGEIDIDDSPDVMRVAMLLPPRAESE